MNEWSNFEWSGSFWGYKYILLKGTLFDFWILAEIVHGQKQEQIVFISTAMRYFSPKTKGGKVEVR